MLSRLLASCHTVSQLSNSCRSTTCRATVSMMSDAPAVTSVASSSYVAGSASIAYVTAPDASVANTLARGLINCNLAACINIIPSITSIYMWEGELNEDIEVLMMIKTKTSKIDDISKYIREHHPYKVAEVISVPIENGNAPYMDFLAKALEK